MNLYQYILKLVGRDSFIKGRMYPSPFIRRKNVEKEKDYYVQYYSVRSERTNKWYQIKIENNGPDIKNVSCNCPQYIKSHTCKHIAAVLLEDITEIVEFEIVDEIKSSNDILDFYDEKIIKKENTIKQKLNLQIEFDFRYEEIFLRFHVGNEKKYILSTMNKIQNFLYSYLNQDEYVFGKNLTYQPNIHYFDKDVTEILDYIIECLDSKERQRYYSNNLSITNFELKNIIQLLKENAFSVLGYGKFKGWKEGFPTEYYLSEKEENYLLTIADYENYKFLNSSKKYLIYKDQFCILNRKEQEYLNILEEKKITALTFPKQQLEKFSNGLFRKIKNNIQIDDSIKEIELPTKPSVQLYFDISYSNLKCDIIFNYKDKKVNYFDTNKIIRDEETEQSVVHEILKYGFIENDKSFIMNDDDMYDFLDESLNELSKTYEVFTSKKIDETNIIKKVSLTNNFSIGKDGIMSYQFSVDGIDNEKLNDLFSALKQKKKYFKLKNNEIVSLKNNPELEELNNLVNDLEINKEDIQQGEAIIPKYRALYIDSLKKNHYKSIQTNNLFDQFITNFKKYKNTSIHFDPDDNILRDYQKEGVKWLYTIYKCNLGGILADEMGLGKSLQTITFIKQILKEKEDAKIIIVVPTSLIYNWQKEFEKFASNLKYIVVADHKQKRKEIFEKKDQYNIFITSYGLIRNDKDEYENIDFELCVVDEAQNIKNYQATMTKEVKKIKAKCKIALTGTPIENNITELWSIFDFIMPGYLNSVIKFKEKYNIKNMDEEDLKILKNLNYQIKPFILRRKKQDVVKSLPEKIENKIYIDLPEHQKMLYLKVLKDTEKEMDEMIQNGGFQKSRMKILQLLTKLRQICIDPSVMYDNYNGESIKLEELLKIVKESIENNHKILIFSSFKRVLENVKILFQKNHITNYMIDGSVKSKDRMDMVEAFNCDDTNCFLITLKSGGTGLNLTGADTVIHLDIWWNPQVENQATDRAHRIGQTKTVSVIKLITKGTIEEKIIELQEKKKLLSDNLIEGKTDHEQLSSLTEKDIRKLLSNTD